VKIFQLNKLKFLTAFVHSNIEAFLKATVLASVSGVLVDVATFAASAHISSCGTNASSKETFASFTAHHAKVVSGGSIVADAAKLLLLAAQW